MSTPLKPWSDVAHTTGATYSDMEDYLENQNTVLGETKTATESNATAIEEEKTEREEAVSGRVPKTTTVNGHTLDDDITITKSDVGLSAVANTGDSDTPVPGGTTKLTTGGAYIALALKPDAADVATRLGYYSPTLFTSSKTYITIPAGVMVRIDNSIYVSTTATTLQASTVASAANRAGHDYYIYACKPSSGTAPVFVLSANSTVPSGYTATNSRKIGGFHCLCVNAGTLTTTNFVGTSVTHPLSGFVAGDILPTTRWDLHHRPRCSPEGMFYCDKADVWMSIYGMSWDGSKLVSVYGGVWADGTSSKKWHGEAFAECLQLQNMRLPWRHEFQMAAKGSNEQTNIKGSADPNTTGGHQDTASRRMLSNYGGEDMCGVLWQWTDDLGFAGGSGWTESCYNSGVDPRSYGQSYGTLYRLRVGACWDDGASCGSRAAFCSGSSSSVINDRGCRAAAEPLVRNVAAEYYNYSPVF